MRLAGLNVLKKARRAASDSFQPGTNMSAWLFALAFRAPQLYEKCPVRSFCHAIFITRHSGHPLTGDQSDANGVATGH
jgi:hypothetical protein